MKRVSRALVLATVVHAVASCGGRASAQDPEDCEAMTASTVARVSDRFSLTPAQSEWLENRWRQGRLEDPSDLETLPDATPALLDELAGAFCWGRRWEGSLQIQTRHRKGEARREVRSHMERAGLGFRVRGRQGPENQRDLRGSLAYRRSGWEAVLGHLRARGALGLLLATPGAELRGGPALGPATSGWGSSLSLDPDLPRGAVLTRESPRGAWSLAVVQNAAGERGWWGAGEWKRRLGGKDLGGTILRGTRGWSGNLWIHQPVPDGSWTAEWAWGRAGSSQGIAWRWQGQRLGLRAGVSRRSSSFHVPEMRAIRNPRNDETLHLATELRWRPGAGRSLTFRFENERRPDRPWMRIRNLRELEWGERLATGLHLGILWRSYGLETREPREEEQRIRGELSYQRREWHWRLRLEERVSTTGSVRYCTYRLGRRGRVSWEIRGDVLSPRGTAPRVWVYRRRAGSAYGWDSWISGEWVGGWFEISWTRLDLEVSADAGTSGWDWIGAIQVPIGRLDRGAGGS